LVPFKKLRFSGLFILSFYKNYILSMDFLKLFGIKTLSYRQWLNVFFFCTFADIILMLIFKAICFLNFSFSSYGKRFIFLDIIFLSAY